MKLSITVSEPCGPQAPFVLQGDYARQIELARELGYDFVELHIRDPKALKVAGIKRSLQATGIRVTTIGTGLGFVRDRLNMMDPDPAIRRAAVTRLRSQIELGAEWDAAIIIGSMKGSLPADPAQHETAQGWMRDCLQEVLETAAKHRVRIALEAINRYETNFLNRGVTAAAVAERVNSEYLGILLDTFHMNIEEVDLSETFRQCAPRLIHVHLADSNRWPAGMGHLDFTAILTELQQIGYAGALGIECLPLPTAEQAAQQALSHLTKIIT